MLDNAIKELEAYRDRLLDQSIQVESMIQNLRTMDNGTLDVRRPLTTDERRQKNRNPEREQRILELLATNSPLTNRQIARHVGCGVSTATASTHALVLDGKLEVSGRRGLSYLYSLPQ